MNSRTAVVVAVRDRTYEEGRRGKRVACADLTNRSRPRSPSADPRTNFALRVLASMTTESGRFSAGLPPSPERHPRCGCPSSRSSTSSSVAAKRHRGAVSYACLLLDPHAEAGAALWRDDFLSLVSVQPPVPRRVSALMVCSRASLQILVAVTDEPCDPLDGEVLFLFPRTRRPAPIS